MRWKELSEEEQLDRIDEYSQTGPVLIFKHSTRCSISSTALARLERAWTKADDERHVIYFLDLLRHRALSNAIAQRYRVEHESPQVLVIHNGRCVHNAAHFGISYGDVLQQMTI